MSRPSLKSRPELSARNIMLGTHRILNILVAKCKRQKEVGELILIMDFILSTISKILCQHVINIKTINFLY